MRREQIAQTLKEIEEKRGARKKVPAGTASPMPGSTGNRRASNLISAVTGLLIGLLLFAMTGGSLIIAGLAAFTGALGLPNWALSFLAKRRIEKFITELPNAMDIIVRGIRAGLPLGDCIREIAASTEDPIRTEFRLIAESQANGRDALRCARKNGRAHSGGRNPRSLPPSSTIQTKSGGNLSEAINNLSRVLRERKKMKGKVQAMSMEAKASAAIIAALPFTVAFLTYLSSPDYIELLWLTITGKVVLGVCAFWMLIGVTVMKNMISFDI